MRADRGNAAAARGEGTTSHRADVSGINHEKQRVAIITDWGYTVTDINAGQLKLQDVVVGEFEKLGSNDWQNLSTGKAVSVTVTHAQVTRIGADALLYRR